MKKLKRYEEEYSLKKAENDKIEKMLEQYQTRYNEDRLNLQSEISQLKKRIQKLEIDEKKYETIIQDYKKIIQRQEQQVEDGSIEVQRSVRCFLAIRQFPNNLLRFRNRTTEVNRKTTTLKLCDKESVSWRAS